MGKIVFFSILFLAIIASIVYLKSNSNTQKEKMMGGKKDRETEKEKGEVKSHLSNDSKILTAIGIMVLFLAGVYIWSGWYSTKHAPLVKTAYVQQQQGILSWEKPEGVVGRNPKLRNLSVIVVINRNDSEIMEFTSPKARFQWNKREKYGRWYQNDQSDEGLWRLLPSKEDENVFVGEESDRSCIFIPLKLELS